jgi:hypothetical protein
VGKKTKAKAATSSRARDLGLNKPKDKKSTGTVSGKGLYQILRVPASIDSRHSSNF